MRDLYRRLNLPAYAPPDDVQRAVTSADVDPALRADAERILLNPEHRPSYDRAHRLLVAVGQLRTRLDLQLRPFWARSGNQDFTAPHHQASVNPVGVIEFYETRPRHHRRLAVALLATLLVLIAAAGVFWRLRH